jgi:xanthine dehydrogenase small subunit
MQPPLSMIASSRRFSPLHSGVVASKNETCLNIAVMTTDRPAVLAPNQASLIRFWRAGERVEIACPSPNQILLEYIRSPEGLAACGTKEGCAEGDCGACTVVIAELSPSSAEEAPPDQVAPRTLKYRAINSCIRFTHQIDGCALWTVEDLVGAASENGAGTLHPVQQAMLEHHGSQCGFCTPGFVMSLFALYQTKAMKPVSREESLAALSGNLCRCTGYQPILAAAQAMHTGVPRPQPERLILEALEQIETENSRHTGQKSADVFRPPSLEALLEDRRKHSNATLIAGATDAGLWITKQGRRFEQVIDITAARDLEMIRTLGPTIEIGAAVRLEEAFEALVKDRPHLSAFARRFAGLPIRQSGTLGGNIANASPIGDSMPLLMALGTQVRLASKLRGSRDLALEDFYLSYRQTALAQDEVLTHILVPCAAPGEISCVYKVSKRFEDDISALCLSIYLSLDPVGKHIRLVRLGVGGMAAKPSRAFETERALLGLRFEQASFEQAQAVLQNEFKPLGDMRATAQYRSQVIGNLLMRFWHEQTSPTQINQLEAIALRPLNYGASTSPAGPL